MTKPPYRVPSMAEIEKIKPNGLKVISTFSGCGGSSLGYRMAGCEVIAASEFVPAAIEVYRLNAKPSTHIFTDDIRVLTPERIMETLGLERGQLDILDGSPPCSAFSTAGKRSEGWGKSHAYSDRHQRVDDLFYEYARILEGLQPRAFIAENVSGLVKGVAKGYFKNIFARLVDCGYQVKASVLDASWLGVPQARQRTIFIGFRNDLGIVPQFPKPLGYQYSLGESLNGLADDHEFDLETNHKITFKANAIYKDYVGLQIGESGKRYFQLVRSNPAKPSNTITTKVGIIGAACPVHWKSPRHFSLKELRRICSFPDDFILTGKHSERAERLGRSVPPVMMKHIATQVGNQLLTSSK